MLRHMLATLAYRAGKALRDAPPEFSGFPPAPGSRSAGEILAHMGDLLDWGASIARGGADVGRLDAAGVERGRRAVLRRACGLRRSAGVGHVGRLRRRALSGADRRPADAHRPDRDVAAARRLRRRAENYFAAEITDGRVGPINLRRVRVLMMKRSLAAVLSSLAWPSVAGAAAVQGAAAALHRSASARQTQPAFPESIASSSEFAAGTHMPGAAWGIVIDGELAHIGVDRLSRRAIEGAGHARFGVPHRLDDQELHRDGDPEAARRRQVVARRPGGEVRAGDEVAGLSDERLAEDHDPPSAVACRGVSRRQPVGRSAACRYRRAAVGDDQGGHPVLERTRRRLRVFELRLRDPRTHRRQRRRAAGRGTPCDRVYTHYVTENVLRPLGMTSTTLEPSSVPADRLAHGYRWEDEQWKNEPLLANGSFGSMGGMLTTLSDLGNTSARSSPRGRRVTAPRRCRSSARRCARCSRSGVRRRRRSRATRRGALQLNAGGYGFGLRISQTCQFPTIVAHGGGLPGFGTQMRWLPEYGVGIIAFGNLHLHRLARDVRPRARCAGAHRRPAAAARPAVAGAGRRARRRFALVVKWDDAAADRIAAVNLFLDESKDRRRAAIEALHAQRRRLRRRAPGFDRVENALRGDWTMTCERGRLQVAITLAPTIPPKVQFMSVTAAPPWMLHEWRTVLNTVVHGSRSTVHGLVHGSEFAVALKEFDMSGLRSRVAVLAFGGVVLAAVALPWAAGSQLAVNNITVNPSLYRQVYYRPLTAFTRGGRVTAVTGVPSKPALFYMGAAGGGVWRSTDSGARWEPLTDGQIGVGTIGAIEVSLSNPDIIIYSLPPMFSGLPATLGSECRRFRQNHSSRTRPADPGRIQNRVVRWICRRRAHRRNWRSSSSPRQFRCARSPANSNSQVRCRTPGPEIQRHVSDRGACLMRLERRVAPAGPVGARSDRPESSLWRY